MTDTIPDMDLVNLTIRVDKKLMAEIERAADTDQRTKSNMVRVLLTEALKAREGK